MSLPPEVEQACHAWLALIDAAAPGLVTGFHLRGGLGFGEYAAGQSDIDAVAVLAHRPSYDEVELLEESHAARPAGPPLDVLHLTAADLEADPEDCPEVPCSLHGWFDPAGRFDLSPVAWHELAHHAVTLRGELPRVWTDAGRLRAFTRETLTGEWSGIARNLARFPAESATEEATWHVLGAARLHHLLATGEQTAKSAAGRWGLGHYDERWHPVLREALRVRGATPDEAAWPLPYDDPAARGNDVAAFVAHVVDSSP